MGTPNGAWACPDLIDTLARLFDWNGGQLHDAVREVLEPAVKLCPEVLIISTAHAGGEWMALVRACTSARHAPRGPDPQPGLTRRAPARPRSTATSSTTCSSRT